MKSDMEMVKKIDEKLIVLLVLVFTSLTFGVEKPTSIQKTCVTEECHGDYSEKAYVHGPVGLGDCKACHKTLDPEKHSFQLLREGREMCEYCHLEQTAKKNIHEPLKEGDC